MTQSGIALVLLMSSILGKNEYSADAEGEENGSDNEEALSLLDITNSDSKEVCKAVACNKACQSDVLYAALGETGRFARAMIT